MHPWLCPWCAVLVLSFSETLNSVQERSSKLPRLVRSIQFTLTEVHVRTSADGEEERHTTTCKYLEDGDRYRCELGGLEHPGLSKPGEFWRAYDGKHYQSFSTPENTLGLSSSPPTEHLVDLDVNPLSFPYFFLFARSESTSSTRRRRLRDPETWSQAFQEARYLTEEKDEKFTYDVVSFPSRDPDVPLKVWFARELGSYPLRFVGENDNGSIRGQLTVSEFKTIEVEDGLIVVPMVLQFEGKDEETQVKRVTTVDPDSLRVNQDIDPGLFTLPRERAARIVDVDVDARRRWPWFLLLTGLAFMVILAVLLVQKRLRARATASILPLAVGIASLINSGCSGAPRQSLVLDLEQGIGPVSFGMHKGEIVELFGEPEIPDSAGMAMAYPSKGFTLGVSSIKGLHKIRCYTKKSAPPAQDFIGSTSNGISMGATEEQVIAAYGPPNERKLSGDQVTLEYRQPQVVFTFWGKKLVEIEVWGPARKEG